MDDNYEQSTSFAKNEHLKLKEGKKLQQEIHQLYREGRSRFDIFLTLFHKLFDNKISDIDVTKWLQRIDQGITSKNEMKDEQWTLFMIVFDELNRLKAATSIWPASDITPKFLNSRYVLQFENATNKMFLLDNFHGQRKQLEIETTGKTPIRWYRVDVVDCDLILLFVELYQRDSFIIYLFNVDYAEAKCTQLASKMLSGDFPKPIFDCTDRRRFLIRAELGPVGLLWMAQIKNNTELVVSSGTIKFVKEPLCPRLMGNKLQVLKMDDENEERKIVFGEYELIENQDRPNFLKLFEIEDGGLIHSLYHENYFWSGDYCYLASYGANETNLTSILVLNLEKRQVINVGCNFYYDAYRGSCINDHIIDDRILSVCVEYRSEQQIVVYRFPLGRPDTLENLSLFKLRRASLFHGNNMYHMLAPNLPSNLRPLSICQQSMGQVTSFSNSW